MKNVFITCALFTFFMLLCAAWNKQLEKEAAWTLSQEIAASPNG